MSLKGFLRENSQQVEPRKLVISKRFRDEAGAPIEWVLRPISEAENAKLRDSCTKMVITSKRRQSDVNGSLYMQRLCAASVTYPDLKSAELQASYGVVGDTDLLAAMLLPGEFGDLIKAVQELNGFEPEALEEYRDEVKNF